LHENIYSTIIWLMTFNDTTTKDGLIQACEDFLFNKYGVISSDSELLFSFTNKINRGLDKTVSLILQNDRYWAFDDSNFTDFPIATTNLVADQQDYTLSVSPEMMIIERVEMKDSSGNWTLLKPFTLEETEMTRDAMLSEAGSTPMYYDKLDHAIILYPKPNYNSTAGLRVYYKRPPSYFTYTDTTKKPGFVQLYHRLPALYACLDYARSNDMNNKIAGITEEIRDMEDKITAHYQDRDADQKIVLRPITDPWRSE